jgi:hypothetical protein
VGDGVLVMAELLGLAVAAVFLAGAIRAVLHPERGWQDQIAGTLLVPK